MARDLAQGPSQPPPGSGLRRHPAAPGPQPEPQPRGSRGRRSRLDAAQRSSVGEGGMDPWDGERGTGGGGDRAAPVWPRGFPPTALSYPKGQRDLQEGGGSWLGSRQPRAHLEEEKVVLVVVDVAAGVGDLGAHPVQAFVGLGLRQGVGAQEDLEDFAVPGKEAARGAPGALPTPWGTRNWGRHCPRPRNWGAGEPPTGCWDLPGGGHRCPNAGVGANGAGFGLSPAAPHPPTPRTEQPPR